jgi:hypothetical protein
MLAGLRLDIKPLFESGYLELGLSIKLSEQLIGEALRPLTVSRKVDESYSHVGIHP